MNGYCKTCCHDDGDIGFCDKCYYSHTLEEKGILPTEYETKPKPMTNADRIRAMTDEEIENWYWWMHKHMLYYTDSHAFVHEWLRQEADNV